MKKVSIVIPVYNAEKRIKECISSVQKQTYNNIEIICVNDGSTDKSLKILQSIHNTENRLVIIDQKNSGAFKARKAGILASTGDYLMFVDSDDCLCDKKAVENLVNLTNKYNADMIQFAHKIRKSFITKNKLLTREGLVTKKDIQKKYFKDYLSGESVGVINVTLWNKLFVGNIMRNCIKKIDTTLDFGEDLLVVLGYMFEDDFKCIYNTNEVYYQYNVGIGYSSRLGVEVFSRYGELKKHQLDVCDKWNLPDEAKYYCNLESIYFLFTVVKKMISDKVDKNKIENFILESKQYECIKIAKEYFKTIINTDYMFEELKFLISDYTVKDYYTYASSKVEKNPGIKNLIRKIF